MRKILIGILIILLGVLSYQVATKGLTIGSLEILSIDQITQQNDNLELGIAEVQQLMMTEYPTKTDELDKSVTKLLEAKDEYLDLASVSTEGELSKSNQEETYTIEYLWAKIGKYASDEGVLLKLEVYPGDTGEANVKNLNYTVNGHYLAIINFMAKIEDDSKLGFRFDSFKLVPSGENLQGTFITRNVRIKQESTTASVSTQNVNDNNDDIEGEGGAQ